MTLRKLFVGCFVFGCQFISAQNDSIVPLREVIVSDAQLKNFSQTQSVSVLNDSVIKKNQSSLTSLLNYNSAIYFKENGLGMVSSPSFRGTTAQQTAVIWNGININSQLNGQTDFNTITTRDFDNVAVRAGGGSAIYGSGAIGGSIHLNNDMVFREQFTNELLLNCGSFHFIGANYKIRASTEKASTQISVSRNSSDNDYKYLDTNRKNENGQFQNTSIHANFGYQLNPATILKFYSQLFEGERHFSGTLAAPSKSKYRNLDTRNLMEWDGVFHSFVSKFKLAFLGEQYTYFEDKDQSFYTTGRAETVVVKHDLTYKVNAKLIFNSIVDFTQTKGFGSDVLAHKRQIASGIFLMKLHVFKQLQYEISVRKEDTQNYKSPFLYAIGTKYDVTKNYNLKLNFSRNFRIPTFNDLYWKGSGNASLNPEDAYQFEVGQEMVFKNIRISATGFYNKIENMISWKPNTSGVWRPENTNKVHAYGMESNLNLNEKIGKHNLNLQANYAYTVSENQETKKQLIYTPFHKMITSLEYSYNKTAIYCQFLYNGKVFTSSDNFYKLQEYKVFNMGFDYDFGKSKTYKIGFQILNLFNEKYQSVSMRPMPGINFNINMNLKL
ncbi:TonB-dependent receptor plug domain-containing protein [Flavobacterium psychrotolerans]|uniref:TonB-dependent receptor n=1 Tax=Flavobacterium psychrotolerans TaxID=2169410 RepID=A0A2U1JJY3_9FLAO|nr:TonB-dependent receptor [Flavobacterium psychrotolerans]PWA05447.1 TonB-dependent receptor [Flavobacterium psychrotolerans]